jgi:hypothetical protein
MTDTRASILGPLRYQIPFFVIILIEGQPFGRWPGHGEILLPLAPF